MRHRSLERAAAAGAALSLLAASAAFADTTRGDFDTVGVGIQSSRDLGNVAPGSVIQVPIAFELACAHLKHVDQGQSLTVAIESAIVAGGTVTMDPVVLGPVPRAWPADGDACSGSEVPIVGPGTLTVTAPVATGSYEVAVVFSRTLSPDGSNDGSAFATTITAASVFLDVVDGANTPPSLVLPGDMTVVADGPDGWTASYVVTATDAEDDPDPLATCAPAVGEVLPLGTTTVECSVTDAGGLTATGSFDVTVEAAPEPEPVVVATTAVFGPPVHADGIDGRAGRTIPLKVRLAAGDVPVGEGSLSVGVSPCVGGEPVAELEMEWRAGSERWFGLLRTRGLDAGCYAVRAVHDGVDVGGFELRLFDKRADVAKEKAGAEQKAGAAKGPAPDRKAAAPDRKAAADVAKATGKGSPAGQRATGKGRP